jgi:hypothetical protein
MKSFTVFGRGELGEREVEGREIEEKLAISLVWQTKEIGERELKHVGPTCFYFSSHERRKAEKGGFFSNFHICPCLLHVSNSAEILKTGGYIPLSSPI